MSSLTRWVLAHKRTVVLAWVVLTIAGVAASGPATDALDPEFSVPNKEGWETNVDIEKHYRGTGGNTSPLVPGGEASAGHPGRLAERESRPREGRPGAREGAAGLARRLLCLDGRQDLHLRRTAARPSA